MVVYKLKIEGPAWVYARRLECAHNARGPCKASEVHFDGKPQMICTKEDTYLAIDADSYSGYK